MGRVGRGFFNNLVVNINICYTFEGNFDKKLKNVRKRYEIWMKIV